MAGTAIEAAPSCGLTMAAASGSAGPGTRAVTLEIRYQGCADLGVCYPPQTRTLAVALPVADAGAVAGLPGASAGSGLRLPGLPGAGPGEPLPQTKQDPVVDLALDPPEDRFLIHFGKIAEFQRDRGAGRHDVDRGPARDHADRQG